MTDPSPAPGVLIARGVARHFAAAGLNSLCEYIPAAGLRCDVAALSPPDEIWIVECKSCRADFRADHKWRGYLDWCDRFFFATPAEFPHEILPPEPGLILADGFGAEIIRDAPLSKLSPARRKAQTLRLARAAMQRLQALTDPPA